MITSTFPCVLAVGVGLAAPSLAQQPTWTEIFGNSSAVGVSADGSHVVLNLNAVWDAEAGVTPVEGSFTLSGVDGSGTRFAGDVKTDALLHSAGYFDGVQWTEMGSFNLWCGLVQSFAEDISDDGTTVVGQGKEVCLDRAFYWRESTGLVALPSAGVGDASALCTNSDGSIVGGWDVGDGNTRQPAIWTDLTQPPTILGNNGTVHDIAADGQTYCGYDAFTAAIFRLGKPTQYILSGPGVAVGQSVLSGCDAAGEVFVGGSGGASAFGGTVGLYYRGDVGAMGIANLAGELGLDIPDPNLVGPAFAVSDDGTTIVGGLLHPLLGVPVEAWVLTLPQVLLFRDVPDVSVSAGGSQSLEIYARPSSAGDLYVVLGSASGTTPGLSVDGAALPLNPDAYLSFLLTNPNTLMAGSFGLLDSLGTASATVDILAGTDPALAGTHVDHAAIVIDANTLAVRGASNAQGLDLAP